jgi:hypothetical protein
MSLGDALRLPKRGRVQEHCHQRSFRNQLTQEPQTLGFYLGREKVYPGRVPAWPIEPGNQSRCDGIAANREHNWNRGGRSFSGQRRRRAANGGDCRHLTAHQVGRSLIRG